jgi:hypothetical protein
MHDPMNVKFNEFTSGGFLKKHAVRIRNLETISALGGRQSNTKYNNNNVSKYLFKERASLFGRIRPLSLTIKTS